MKDWLINLAVELLLKAIADERIEELAHTIQSFMIPYMVEQKDELIRRLKAKAATTETKVDDAVYHALDVFLTSFIPKDAQCLVQTAAK